MNTNNEAQFFLGNLNPKHIFELALNHAPKRYGISTKFIDLSIKLKVGEYVKIRDKKYRVVVAEVTKIHLPLIIE